MFHKALLQTSVQLLSKIQSDSAESYHSSVWEYKLNEVCISDQIYITI